MAVAAKYLAFFNLIFQPIDSYPFSYELRNSFIFSV